MRRVVLAVLAIGVGCLIGFMIAVSGDCPWPGKRGQHRGGFGCGWWSGHLRPYDVAKNWPADISTVPGNEQ